VITPARRGALIRGGQLRIDFGTTEKFDQSPAKTLAGDGQQALDLGGTGRRLESCKTKKSAEPSGVDGLQFRSNVQFGLKIS
jgi:hypothetical protein